MLCCSVACLTLCLAGSVEIRQLKMGKAQPCSACEYESTGLPVRRRHRSRWLSRETWTNSLAPERPSRVRRGGQTARQHKIQDRVRGATRQYAQTSYIPTVVVCGPSSSTTPTTSSPPSRGAAGPGLLLLTPFRHLFSADTLNVVALNPSHPLTVKQHHTPVASLVCVALNPPSHFKRYQVEEIHAVSVPHVQFSDPAPHLLSRSHVS